MQIFILLFLIVLSFSFMITYFLFFYKEKKTDESNKKIRKILIGLCRTGKSRYCIEQAVKYEGTVIYFDGVYIEPDEVNNYFDYYQLDKFKIRNNERAFILEEGKKWFILPSKNNKYDLFSAATSFVYSCHETGTELVPYTDRLLIYDDGAWLLQENKYESILELTTSDCDVIITVQREEDLFGTKLSQLLKDTLKKDNWEIIYLEQ